MVWKEPAFFLAHPRAIAAFGRECTLRGVPPPTATIFGSPFLTWRGIPLVPTDKLGVDEAGKTNILLLRTGEKKQGVVGLFQPGLPGEQTPGLSVRFMGIDRNSIASYLVSCIVRLQCLPTTHLACSRTLKSDTTMSTSNQDRAIATLRLSRMKPSPTGALPDVATLTQLANEFFRAQPASAFPTSVVPSVA